MSSYGSRSPEGPDMECYEPQFYCPARPHYHSLQDLHCQNGLGSPALQEPPEPPEEELTGRCWGPRSPSHQGELYHSYGTYSNNYGYGENGVQNVHASPDHLSHHQTHFQEYQSYNGGGLNCHGNSTGLSNIHHSSSTPALHSAMECCDVVSSTSSISLMQQHSHLISHQHLMNDSQNMMHREGDNCIDNNGGHQVIVAPFVRVVKRRNTANKKERRRTQSINTAFADLRECIPNVPADTKLSKVSERKEKKRSESINQAFSQLRGSIPNVPRDTKLSKIKTLRLATSYISYLMGVLESDLEPAGGFRAELGGAARRGASRAAPQAGARARNNNNYPDTKDISRTGCEVGPGSPLVQEGRRTKGRTGWPQHVWALELKQEQNL